MNHSVRRVVVGVDGSAGSLVALRQAAGEARRHGAELHPVFIYSSPQGDYIDLLWPPDERTARELAHQARDDLHDACVCAFGGEPDGLRCSPVVVRGRTGPALVASAAEDGDLLVVGGGSHGAVHRFLTGSVSRYCVRHARGPVLVVPAAGARERHRDGRRSAVAAGRDG
ncbi:universal stress protein [Streptomyces sp. AV19]|uniref:universal stress protein n=1 Tax=Streptomyces sp. AV19 TaxID=2793068 RepID=UPI0018FE8630|nr:universal stress protein [Streptomyces sp. AV19]MBH1934507.1 universal stress protein [Streptomyces sp. AV19]MDG4533301.1 universal stress protein [Streptomyces sp. AV19]